MSNGLKKQNTDNKISYKKIKKYLCSVKNTLYGNVSTKKLRKSRNQHSHTVQSTLTHHAGCEKLTVQGPTVD